MRSLCHPDLEKSCGACCGLYNYVDHRRETLRTLLEKRTSFFLSQRPSPEWISFYKKEAKQFETSSVLCHKIYCCEFLGFVDQARKRVGCLLHPALWGEDLRDFCFYGKELCSQHLCPSHTYLSEDEKGIVIKVIQDWYLYGLVITDLDLVRESLALIANGIGRSLRVRDVEEPLLKRALGDFFALKENWPFKDHRLRLGRYWFSQGEYRLDHPWDDPWDKILGCLETAREKWEEAKLYLKDRIKELIHLFKEVLGG